MGFWSLRDARVRVSANWSDFGLIKNFGSCDLCLKWLCCLNEFKSLVCFDGLSNDIAIHCCVLLRFELTRSSSRISQKLADPSWKYNVIVSFENNGNIKRDRITSRSVRTSWLFKMSVLIRNYVLYAFWLCSWFNYNICYRWSLKLCVIWYFQ